MPSAMLSTEPRDDSEALVTLTQVKDDGSTLGFLTRRAILTPRHKRLTIGRASMLKSDRNPSLDNGLFENPVVSRCHAGIEWEEASQSLFYIDTKSTHGSKINNKPVDPLRRQSLKAGDKITLGNFIHSRDKGFPPLHLQVGLKIGPPRSFSMTTQPRQRVAAPAPWRMPTTRRIPTYTVPDDSESDSGSPEPPREPTYYEISDSEEELLAGDMSSDEDDGVEESAQTLSSPIPPATANRQIEPTLNSDEQIGQNDLTYEVEDELFASEDEEEDEEEDHRSSDVEASDDEEERNIEDSLLGAQVALMDETLLHLPMFSDTDSFMPTSMPPYNPMHAVGTSTSQPPLPLESSATVAPNNIVFQDLDEVIREQNTVGGKGSIGYILQDEHTVDVFPSPPTSGPAAPEATVMSEVERRASPDTPCRKRKLDDAMIEEIQDEVVNEMTTPIVDIVGENGEAVDTLTQSFASKSLRGQDENDASSGESHEAALNTSSATQLPQPPASSAPMPSVMETGPARKRLRRVAEAMGYATLGGAAVLTALIATAPAL